MMRELTVGQKMLHQRLLAAHCLPEAQVRALWNELRQGADNMGASTLEKSLAVSNEQLALAGLEIAAVSFHPIPTKKNRHRRRRDDDEEEEDDVAAEDSSSKSLARGQPQRWYALVNQFPDELTRQVFQSAFTPAQHPWVLAVLERLAQQGPATTASRSELLSLRTTCTPNNNNPEGPSTPGETAPAVKLTLASAEEALDRLLEEMWLVPAPAAKDDDHDDEDPPKNRKRKSSAATSSSSSSMHVMMGPRSYLEFGPLMTTLFGMDKDDLPQQIYHRL